MVAAENMLTVFVNDYDLVIPNSCFYPCDSWDELLEKETELKKIAYSGGMDELRK